MEQLLCENLRLMDIGRELRRRILTGRYAAGQRIPPERELEQEFGCSRPTVAKAMAPLVDAGLIERHRGRGTFVVGAAGAQSRGRTATAGTSGRGNVVKYISPGQDRAGRNSRDDVLAGMHSVLNDSGYHVSVDFYSDLEQHLGCLSKAVDPQIAGLALWPAPHERTLAAVEAAMRQGLPLVLIDTYLPGLDCDYVVTDNIEGAAMMVHHLAGLGHQRISYITAPVNRTSVRDRLSGYLRGMVEDKLPVGDKSVVQLECDNAIGEQLNHELGLTLDRLIAGGEVPTALFVSHDSLALALLPLLKARGVRVPADLALVGYDGIEAGELCSVPLTTIKQDFFGMAQMAGRILLERFDGRSEPLRYHLMIKPQLVVRASCAAPSVFPGQIPAGFEMPQLDERR